MHCIRSLKNKNRRSRFGSKDGTALIWTLVVVLVLAVILAAGFNMVQRQLSTAVVQHTENQAWYTAMSVTRAVVYWLSEAMYDNKDLYTLPESVKEQNALIKFLILNPEQEYEIAPKNLALPKWIPLGENGGEYKIYISSNSDKNAITVRTEAVYQGSSETVSGIVYRTSSDKHIGGEVCGWAKIVFPEPAAYVENGELHIKGVNGQPDTVIRIDNLPLYPGVSASPTGSYRIESGVVEAPCKVLVATGSGGTVHINKKANGIGTLVIAGNAEVKPSNGSDLIIGNIVIENGGVLNIANGSSLQDVNNIFVMPGGRFINLNNSQWFITAALWLFASDLPAPPNTSPAWPAYDILGNVSWPVNPDPAKYQFPGYVNIGKATMSNDVIIQPARPDLPFGSTDLPSYYALLADLNLKMTNNVIHIPEGYETKSVLLNDYPNVAIRACTASEHNFVVSSLPLVPTPPQIANMLKKHPYCPHFFAKNEADVPYESIYWKDPNFYGKH